MDKINFGEINFGEIGKINVEKDIYNEDTDKEFFNLHFNYTTKDNDFITSFGESLQELCNKEGYKVYVDIETLLEIRTIQIEIHTTEYENEEHINKALEFIANYANNIN